MSIGLSNNYQEEKSMMGITEIMDFLPHRYPFLMVDRVLEFSAGESLVGIKNVTINEPFFQGHFPEKAIMPGVLIIEALAQATGLLAFSSNNQGAERDTLYYLVGIDKARFKQPVVPGDQLRLEVNVTVSHPGFYNRIVFGGSVGAGEAYMMGFWHSDDLTMLIRIILLN